MSIRQFNKRDALSLAGTVGLVVALLATAFGGEVDNEMAERIAQVIGSIATAIGYGGASVADAAERK